MTSVDALIIGASGGIGAALADEAEKLPWVNSVTTLSRRDDGFDLCNEDSVATAAATVSGRTFGLIVNATGALAIEGEDGARVGPEKSFQAIDPAIMLRAFQVNAVGGALVFKHFSQYLPRKGPAVFGALSARVGSIEDNLLGGWVSYRAAKAALNQIIRCAAIEQTRRNPESIVVALHPGTIDTPLTRAYAKGRYTATPGDCAQNLFLVLKKLTPEQSGRFFDYAGKEIPW